MTIHRCDICGKVSAWDKATWRSTTYFLGRYPLWWEEDIETCGTDCEVKLDTMMEGKNRRQVAEIIKAIRKRAVETKGVIK